MITLHFGAAPTTITSDRVFFAFADGRLDYDCGSCGATCCRGHGYMLREDELRVQLQRRKHLALFVQPHAQWGGQHPYQIANCTPSCFFLRDGLCEIHAEHGHAAKPETCRLFPFNNFVRVGAYLVVAPHPSLCPLRVVDTPQRSSRSSYEGLISAMALFGITNEIPRAHGSEPEAARLFALERDIVQLSEEHLDREIYAAFVRDQMIATRDCVGPRNDGRLQSEADDVRGFSQALTEVLGLSADERSEQAVARVMIASTPALRMRLLLGADGTRSPNAARLRRLPYGLLVLNAFASLASAAGMSPVTYQTVSRFVRSETELLNLLSNSDRPMFWRGDVDIGLSFGENRRERLAYYDIAKSLLSQRRRTTPHALSTILAHSLPSDPLDRVSFLRRLAREIGEKLVPIRSGGTRHGKWRFRAYLQQTAVRRLPAQVLLVAAAKQDSMRARRAVQS